MYGMSLSNDIISAQSTNILKNRIDKTGLKYGQTIKGLSLALQMLIMCKCKCKTTSSRWQVDKEAIDLSRVQQFYHL